MKNPWIIVGAITVILFGGAIWYSSVSAERNNEGVEVKQHIKGNPEAAVVLVEYSDFQCPACAAFQPFVDEIVTEYGDRLRFEYKHFPLPIHPSAIPAGVAAEAAGQQGKFFEYHDALFLNQSTWSASVAPQALFVQYAEALDLDMDLFRKHINSTILRDQVRGGMAEGRELGITGTPTFFLNGERMEIATYDDFKAQIVAAIDPTAAEATGGEVLNVPAEAEVRFGL
jgi:protein-disulfide isomerase